MANDLRYYQKEAIASVNGALKKGIKKNLLVMATGTGKSKTAIETVRDFNKKLWITHEESLMEQSGIAALIEYFPHVDIIALIESYGGFTEYVRYIQKNPLFVEMSENEVMRSVSIIKADLFGTKGELVLASAQTLYRRLDKIQPDLFEAVVADEAHLFGSKTFNKSLQHFDPKLLLGLTATPTRSDGMKMGDIFDQIAYEYPIDKGIDDGFLCELDARRVKTNVNLDEVRTTAGELNQKDLEAVVNTEERNQLIVDKYKEYALGRQFVAYCVDVKHAQDLNSKFLSNGLKTDIVVANELITPDRRRVLDELKYKKINGAINVRVLTTGFDYRNLGCVIHGSPTKSLTDYIQKTGRGTRLKDDEYVSQFGQNCIILDFVDVTFRHRLINTWTLDKGKPTEQKTFLTKKQKSDIVEAREAKFRVADPKQKGDVKVDLFKLPKVEQSTSYKMQEPASEKQLALIAKHGYDVVNENYTKAMCSEIISNLPAFDWSIKVLKSQGYDVSEGVTFGEYQMALQEIEKRKEDAKKEAEKANKVQIEKEDNLFDLPF